MNIRKLFQRLQLGNPQSGRSSASVLVVLGIAIPLAVMLVSAERYSPQPPTPTQSQPGGITCCDTGNGDACRPREDVTLTYNGVTYGLLKSNFIPTTKVHGHLVPTNQFNPAGDRVFVNTASSGSPNLHQDYTSECGTGTDYIRSNPRGDKGTTCIGIADDQIIYTCRKDNAPGICDKYVGTGYFDAYFRMNDYPTPGIPDVVKNCTLPEVTGTIAATDSGQIILYPTYPNPGKSDLQLETFWITQASMSAVEAYWISPFCKPAIYLYPETRQSVNVKVYPLGKMTLTIPKYPDNGWTVFADTTGDITYQNKVFDYLYYEAEISDTALSLPEEGYVIRSSDLKTFLPDLVRQLGLNEKETRQFSEYWLDVLPEPPYYQIKVVKEEVLDAIAPLVVVPKPATTIRVTLHFEPKDSYIRLSEPVIKPVQRKGFTMVEWGGLFKRDKDTPFSCFM